MSEDKDYWAKQAIKRLEVEKDRLLQAARQEMQFTVPESDDYQMRKRVGLIHELAAGCYITAIAQLCLEVVNP